MEGAESGSGDGDRDLPWLLEGVGVVLVGSISGLDPGWHGFKWIHFFLFFSLLKSPALDRYLGETGRIWKVL